MIQPFVPSARGWISGTGLRAKWDYADLGNLVWNPQYLMASGKYDDDATSFTLKVGFCDISRDIDVRSFQGTVVPSFPCGNSAPVLSPEGDKAVIAVPQLLALLNSFVFGWIIRQRGGAAPLNWHLLAEMAFPNSASATIWQLVSRLNLHSRTNAPSVLRGYGLHVEAALLDGERHRLRPAIDALAAVLCGVEADDLAHVLHETDLPVAAIRRKSHELNVCGFSVLTLIVFHDLEAKIEAVGGDREQGIEAFFAQNDGEGWMLPETLCLADYGLGHDERADPPQPVASRLGPRFYDWQLARSADESWRECHLHARNLLGAHD